MAIFEFSSSNGFSSFNLNFECRNIEITEIVDGNQSHFSYLVHLPYGLRSYTSCEERGYEECSCDECQCWESMPVPYCITTFQG